MCYKINETCKEKLNPKSADSKLKTSKKHSASSTKKSCAYDHEDIRNFKEQRSKFINKIKQNLQFLHGSFLLTDHINHAHIRATIDDMLKNIKDTSQDTSQNTQDKELGDYLTNTIESDYLDFDDDRYIEFFINYLKKDNNFFSGLSASLDALNLSYKLEQPDDPSKLTELNNWISSLAELKKAVDELNQFHKVQWSHALASTAPSQRTQNTSQHISTPTPRKIAASEIQNTNAQKNEATTTATTTATTATATATATSFLQVDTSIENNIEKFITNTMNTLQDSTYITNPRTFLTQRYNSFTANIYQISEERHARYFELTLTKNYIDMNKQAEEANIFLDLFKDKIAKENQLRQKKEEQDNKINFLSSIVKFSQSEIQNIKLNLASSSSDIVISCGKNTFLNLKDNFTDKLKYTCPRYRLEDFDEIFTEKEEHIPHMSFKQYLQFKFLQFLFNLDPQLKNEDLIQSFADFFNRFEADNTKVLKFYQANPECKSAIESLKGEDCFNKITLETNLSNIGITIDGRAITKIYRDEFSIKNPSQTQASSQAQSQQTINFDAATDAFYNNPVQELIKYADDNLVEFRDEDKSIKEKKQTLLHSKDEWKSETDNAVTIKKGYKKADEKGVKYIYVIRGDNYCALRSTLAAVVYQNEIPHVVQRMQKYLDRFDNFADENKSIIENWDLQNLNTVQSHNVDRKKLLKAIMVKAIDILKTIDKEKDISTKFESYKKLINGSTTKDYILYETLKLLIIIDADMVYAKKTSSIEIKSEIDALSYIKTKNDTYDDFLGIFSVRDTAADLMNYFNNHIKNIGIGGGLEQTEVMYLGYILRTQIHVLRHKEFGKSDYESYLPEIEENDRKTHKMPTVNLSSEDDRHYNFLALQ